MIWTIERWIGWITRFTRNAGYDFQRGSNFDIAPCAWKVNATMLTRQLFLKLVLNGSEKFAGINRHFKYLKNDTCCLKVYQRRSAEWCK